MTETGRVKVRMRRGMRELDVMLERFFECRFDALNGASRTAFERLLETPDPELADWLFGRRSPADPALAALVQTIRETAGR